MMTKTSDAFNKFKGLLFKPVDPGSLALFRLLFGIVLAYYAYKEAHPQIIYFRYVLPDFHFTYPLFDWLGFKPLPLEQLQLITKLMGICATFVAFGFLTRISLAVFIMSFGYLFLLEKAFYNNHYYLIILFAFILIFTGSHRTLSLDALRAPATFPPRIPFWNIFLLRAQICIVYFFAAIVKLNPDYLSGRYMSVWLIKEDKFPFLKSFVPMDLAVILFTYGGFFFDLLIGFFLCYRPTRYAAFFACMLFHALNSVMFPMIGIFPALMIATLVLFIEPDQMKMVRQRLRSLYKGKEAVANAGAEPTQVQPGGSGNKLTMGLIMLYLLIQVLVPLRHWLIPGNTLWTQEGSRFSWMVMSSVVEGRVKIIAVDPSTQNNVPVDPLEDLTPAQYINMTYKPDMLLQYVHFLKKKLKAQGMEDPAIYVEGQLSINGRDFFPYIDPRVNLAGKKYTFMRAADWILPPPEGL